MNVVGQLYVIDDSDVIVAAILEWALFDPKTELVDAWYGDNMALALKHQLALSRIGIYRKVEVKEHIFSSCVN